MKLCDLPDLAKSLQKMKIMIDLQIAATGEDLISISIRLALYERRSPSQTITWIKSQATDNSKIMAEVIGEDLTNRILNF